MKDIVISFVRHALTAGGAIFVAKGGADPGEMETMTGALVTVVGLFWSIWEKRAKAKELSKIQAESKP